MRRKQYRLYLSSMFGSATRRNTETAENIMPPMLKGNKTGWDQFQDYCKLMDNIIIKIVKIVIIVKKF